MTPYSLASLTTALGIRAGHKVSLINPPPGFVHRLNPLPDGVEFLVTASSGLDVILFFATSQRELQERLPALVRAVHLQGAVWVCWPSPVHLQSALTEDSVRRVAPGPGDGGQQGLLHRLGVDRPAPGAQQPPPAGQARASQPGPGRRGLRSGLRVVSGVLVGARAGCRARLRDPAGPPGRGRPARRCDFCPQ